MGTNERDMACIHDVTGRAVGLPPEIGGIPLDEIGATGFGLSVALEVAQPYADFEIAGARVAVQGFGAVGAHVARFLTDRGAILVGASDSQGTTLNPNGLDMPALLEWSAGGNKLSDFEGGEPADVDAIISADCDVWIPAARPNVLNRNNVARLKAKVVLEGANVPATSQAEKDLTRRGVLVIPDFIANSGGVICASVEFLGGDQAMAMAQIENKIRFNTEAMLKRSFEDQVLPRDAAVKMAEQRVRRAMTFRKTC